MFTFFITFLQLAGFIVGLGAVTVIDFHGFIAQKSVYWTRVTISAHKVTKPLIWLGTIMLLVGKILKYFNEGFSNLLLVEFGLLAVLILNGCFLSFYVSPFLIKLEKQGVQKPLPNSLQNKIKVSFLFSFFGWWVLVLLFILSIINVNL